MGRPRKNQAKPPSKSPPKFVAVRKSTRQIARKQRKQDDVIGVNGEILQTSRSNSTDDSGESKEDSNPPKLPPKRSQPVPGRKPGRPRTVNRDKPPAVDKIVEESENSSKFVRDATESDSQDAGDEIAVEPKNLTAEDVRQMVVGAGHSNERSIDESAPSEVQWSEDVIEETIICEEMEVEGDSLEGSRYTLADDGSVVLEEVLLVNESGFEGDNVVEFTVIRNEDGTESMVESMVVAADTDVTSMNNHYDETSEYRIIEEGVNCLHMSEISKDASCVVKDKINDKSRIIVGEKSNSRSRGYNSDSSKDSRDKVAGRKKSSFVRKDKTAPNAEALGKILDKSSKRVNPNVLKEDSGSSVDFNEENGSCGTETLLGPDTAEESSNSEIEKLTMKNKASKDDIRFEKIDDDLQGMRIVGKSKVAVATVDPSDLEDTSSTSDSSATRKEIPMVVQTIHDDEDSAPTSDKSERSRSEENFVGKAATKGDSNEKMILEGSITDADDRKGSPKPESARANANRSNPISTRSLPDNHQSQSKNTDRPQNIEELSRDSEMDGKADSEDTKLSSSSENSNDTLLSLNSCKLPNFDSKTPISLGEVEKKVGFRSRSGSTDTTGSESGSNSSAVRRSSRIRSIGLMKQRSRGRGLVTKPNLDLSKVVVQQERDRLASSAATTIQDLRDTLDSQSETQSDREGSNKTAISGDSLAPLTTGVTGYDSDSSKPVKVKSRWRRSSELEMGGSASGSRLGFSSLGSVAGSGSGPGSATGSDFGSGPSCPGSGSSSAAVTPVPNDSDFAKEPGTFSSNSSHVAAMSPVPRNVGARISLPMVLEVKDREMEERLSQFEHLRENAYLTERYTNKETKRMVCDCFLTEEEIERGELGCGEDCLNRLLMIECGSRCVVSDRCTNKRFQNCEYAKCEVFRTEKKGFGLRATSDLLAGEFIMEYVGEVLDAKDFRRRAKDYSKDKNRHYYFMALKSDQIIDATMKGNISRFINHSCDPNAETQKWTVNGELRIGFFNRRFIAAGEEITFDYHFQRYGKEAQKCYCEATTCRGWIGDTPEEEKEKIEKKEKRDKEEKEDKDEGRKKKKEAKKPVGYMEDEDLEEEIDKLRHCGLKNRAHTLTLSRLMVRSRELEHRTRLLRIIQSGEQPCRRLFLDYHGLRLIWSYMMDIAAEETEEAHQFRLEVLKTLSTLPIPNKTMLMDSKVFSVVQKWSEERYLSPRRESPEDEQSSKTMTKVEEIDSNCDSNEKLNAEQCSEAGAAGSSEKEVADEIKQEPSDQALIPELSSNLLNEWNNLKEVFRIPKKERIEQMKEHEREADRGYREDLEKEDIRETYYDRTRSDRYGRGDSDKRTDRRRGRESPELETYRSKDKRGEERSNLVPVPRLSKFERRQLFAMKVAKEEEERLRRQQQESWQEHEARCIALGIDPHTTAAVDPQTGYPLFFNPALGQWQPYPLQDGDIAGQCTPMYTSAMPSGHPSEISPAISQNVYGAGFPQTSVTYPGMSHHLQQYTESNLVQVHNGTPPITMPGQPLYVDKPPETPFTTAETAEPVEEPSPQSDVPPIDLPPKWKCAKDGRGRLYYYHVKERISQWLPPPPDHIGVQPDSSSSSESSDESSSSNEEEDDQDEDRGNEAVDEDMDCTAANTINNASGNAKHPAANKLDPRGIVGGGPTVVVPEPKKRRDGLVQERIISPRREEDRVDHKKYKDVKEKMRRQKERARLKEHVDKLRKHRRANKSKSHSRHGASKVQQDASSDVIAAAERKIKDTFRINMANVMVHFLNPYRKNDCKQGRITNTEDFKHLARKLTHFVLAKELKHCKSVDELQCNDNVKHKAKDFVQMRIYITVVHRLLLSSIYILRTSGRKPTSSKFFPDNRCIAALLFEWGAESSQEAGPCEKKDLFSNR